MVPCICPLGVLIHWHIYYMCNGKFPLAQFLNLLCFIKNRMKYPLCMFTLKVCVGGVSQKTPLKYKFIAGFMGEGKERRWEEKIFFSKKDFVAFGTVNNLCGKCFLVCLILCQGSCWCSSILQQIRGQLKRDFPPSRTKQGQLAWGQLVLVANVLKNLLHIIWNSFYVRLLWLRFLRSSSNSKSNGSSWIRKWQVMHWHCLPRLPR